MRIAPASTCVWRLGAGQGGALHPPPRAPVGGLPPPFLSMSTSSKTILVGVGLLFVPIPPIATIAGVGVIALGVAKKVLGSE